MKKIYLIGIDNVGKLDKYFIRCNICDLKLEENEVEIVYGYSLLNGLSPLDRSLMVYLCQQGVTKFGVVLVDKDKDDSINKNNLNDFKKMVDSFMLADITVYFNDKSSAIEYFITRRDYQKELNTVKNDIDEISSYLEECKTRKLIKKN